MISARVASITCLCLLATAKIVSADVSAADADLLVVEVSYAYFTEVVSTNRRTGKVVHRGRELWSCATTQWASAEAAAAFRKAMVRHKAYVPVPSCVELNRNRQRWSRARASCITRSGEYSTTTLYFVANDDDLRNCLDERGAWHLLR